jgi:hypothetical protein
MDAKALLGKAAIAYTRLAYVNISRYLLLNVF